MKLRPFVLGLLLACGDDPEPAWKLDRPRVLAAAVSAAADPARSSIVAGERVEVRLVTSSAAVTRGAFATNAFRACAADPNVAVVACGGPDLPFEKSPDRDPVFTFAAPPSQVLLFGVVCQSGPRLEPTELRGSCDGPGQEVSVRIDVGGPENHQPTFDEARARIDGLPLAASDDCTGRKFPADGKEHRIEIGVGSEPGDDPLLEHVATLGDLEQLYTIPDGSGLAQIKWTAPSAIDVEAKPVRFELVLRDGRGGTALSTRMICLSKGE